MDELFGYESSLWYQRVGDGFELTDKTWRGGSVRDRSFPPVAYAPASPK